MKQWRQPTDLLSAGFSFMIQDPDAVWVWKTASISIVGQTGCALFRAVLVINLRKQGVPKPSE